MSLEKISLLSKRINTIKSNGKPSLLSAARRLKACCELIPYITEMAYIIKKLGAEVEGLKRTIKAQEGADFVIDCNELYRRHNVTYVMLGKDVVVPGINKSMFVFKSLVTGKIELRTAGDFLKHYRKINEEMQTND